MIDLYIYKMFDIGGKCVFSQNSLREKMQDTLAEMIGDPNIVDSFPFETSNHKGYIVKNFEIDPVMYTVDVCDGEGHILVSHLVSRLQLERYLEPLGSVDLIDKIETSALIKSQKPDSDLTMCSVTITKNMMMSAH